MENVKCKMGDFVGTNGMTQNGVECNGTIEATEAGTYTITAAADGYVSTTATIDNTKEYELTKAIDFTALKATDLSSNWVLLNANTSVPGSSSQWKSKYPDVVTDEYYYNFSSETASATDVIPGLNIEFDETGKTPKLYTGFGFMYPVHVLGADGTEAASPAINDGKIAINEGTAEQFGVYTYINNYGKNGTMTTILTGDQPFSLYRFSDLLTKIEIYSPKISTETVTVTEAGLATYCPSYGLDFTSAKNIAAYKASVSGNEVTLTKVTTVAKGEGVLLRSINGGAAAENIAVNVDATKNNGNAFVGTSKDITINETDGDKTNYVLSKENDVMGFYKAKPEANGGTKVAAGKAYLPVLTSDAAKGIKVVFDGETTGISTVKDNTVKDNTIYNLNGQRVAAPAKGLYIMNGKKVVIK